MAEPEGGPTGSDRDAARASYLGERIGAGPFFSLPEYVNFLKHVAAYRRARPAAAGKRVLDLGCGTGYGTRLLADDAARVVGLDLGDARMAGLDRELGGSTLQFRSYAGDALPFSAGAFDLVVSFQVIEHVADVAAYLQEIARVLAPGGLFLVTTPNRRIRLLPGQRPWNPNHLREYSFAELKALLAPRFADARGYSLEGPRALAEIELRRVRQNPLAVYVERPLKRVLRRVLRISTSPVSAPVPAGPALSEQELARFGPEDLRYEPTDDPKALDLLFECRVPAPGSSP